MYFDTLKSQIFVSAFDVMFLTLFNIVFIIWDVEKPDEVFEEPGRQRFTKIEPNNDTSIDF